LVVLPEIMNASDEAELPPYGQKDFIAEARVSSTYRGEIGKLTVLIHFPDCRDTKIYTAIHSAMIFPFYAIFEAFL
jgi:hypothetical protein